MRFLLLEKQEKPYPYIIYDTHSEIERIFFPQNDPGLRGDITDFLNDKYCDKEINEEWHIDEEKRIKHYKEQIRYYEDQIKILESGKAGLNEHGNGVE